jgi:hypothetical protein
MTIRPAVAADYEALVALGRQFAAESPHGVTDPLRVALAVRSTLEHGIVQVLEDGTGAIVGMLGLLIGPHPLTGAMTGFEVAWYLNPAARGGSGAIKLVKACELAALREGAHFLQLGAPDARVGDLLARLGYDAVETTFRKAVA